ncbi:MAG: DNA primase small subunit domain-containing protein [Candidatus Aenigmatarchaeota archaeon]
MNLSEVIKYYSRDDIQKEITMIAKGREVVGSLENGSFLSRPDIIVYPNDIMERVKKGVVSFHCSVERWTQPMQLSTELSPKEINSMRSGFDFIIDIDAKAKLEHAVVGTRVVYNFLKDMGVMPTIKFSGSRGFHIAIAKEAFPEKIDFKEISKRYPEIPRTLAEYIRYSVKERLLEELIEMEGGVSSLIKTVDSVSELSPYEFLEIEKDWGNRHLFRMPYSLHTKFWLVSKPIRFEDLKHFNKDIAKPENVKTDVKFLVNKEGEAAELLLKSLEWKAKQPKEKEIVREFKGKKFSTPIAEENFPPCIKNILKGIPDGKKRSLFTLITFLKNMNWTPEDIEKRIMDWNNENYKPLSNRFIKTQLKWHTRQNRDLMPANCESSMFYKSIGVCQKERYCRKNPVNYVYKKLKVKKGG